MLLENLYENEDTLSLSHHLDSEVQIDYNLPSLMKSEFVYDVDPELINPDISNAEYLFRQRKRAETKLVKSKIIYKVHQGDELSVHEKKYLKTWISALDKSNLNNHRDSMVPKMHST